MSSASSIWRGNWPTTLRKRAARHDEEGSFPFENYERLKDSGYTLLTIPESLGGLGATMLERIKAQERLAQGCGATALAINMHFKHSRPADRRSSQIQGAERRAEAAPDRGRATHLRRLRIGARQRGYRVATANGSRVQLTADGLSMAAKPRNPERCDGSVLCRGHLRRGTARTDHHHVLHFTA